MLKWLYIYFLQKGKIEFFQQRVAICGRGAGLISFCNCRARHNFWVFLSPVIKKTLKCCCDRMEDLMVFKQTVHIYTLML